MNRPWLLLSISTKISTNNFLCGFTVTAYIYTSRRQKTKTTLKKERKEKNKETSKKQNKKKTKQNKTKQQQQQQQKPSAKRLCIVDY